MKKLLLIAAAVLAGASGLRAEEYTAISPDGKITVTVSTAPELRWSVTREGERLLDASRIGCLLYTSPSPRDGLLSRMPSSA